MSFWFEISLNTILQMYVHNIFVVVWLQICKMALIFLLIFSKLMTISLFYMLKYVKGEKVGNNGTSHNDYCPYVKCHVYKSICSKYQSWYTIQVTL